MGSGNPTDTDNPFVNSPSVEDLISILNQNKDKNFVQRILKPDLNPVLMDYAGPGTHGTHLMSSSELPNGMGFVYPEIIQGPDGNLIRLGRREAMEYAVKSGEHISFSTPEEAEWFGKNYKKVWGRN
jgi:hypothetical protein